ADLVARIQRLEGQNRTLTGQVQELQNAVRRMAEDFQKYRDDTEYRLQTLEGGGKAPPAPRRSQAPAAPMAAPAGMAAAPAPNSGAGRGAPPAPLGTLPSSPGQDAMMDGGGDPSMAGGDGADAAPGPDGPLQLPSYQPPPEAAPPGRQMSGLAPPGLPGVAVD